MLIRTNEKGRGEERAAVRNSIVGSQHNQGVYSEANWPNKHGGLYKQVNN